MHLKLKFTVMILAAAAALTTAAFAFAAPAAPENTPVQAAVQTTASPSPAVPTFVLREYDGRVAVFYTGYDRAPVTVTNIETKTLREADRRLLQRGIEAGTHEEVLMLLEDFGS